MSIEKQVAYEGQKKTDTLDGRVRIEEGNGRLIVSNGTNNVALFGYDSEGNIAVKVAKPGFDADTAGDESLAFSSEFNYFKIVLSGTYGFNTLGTSLESFEYSIPHGLGFPPAFIGYYYDAGDPDNPDVYRSLPSEIRDDSGALIYSLDMISTPTDVKISFYGGTGGYASTFHVRYYILQETAD